MSASNSSHLESIKEAVHSSEILTNEEKSSSVQIIEEWVIEDKAMSLLSEQLLAVSSGIKPLLAELGLI